MKINYKVFSKHAEKVAKGVGESRPILKGIHHDDKGTLTVTDSFRLYQAYNVNAPRDVVLDAVTGEEIDAGNYPEVGKLIPEPTNATAQLSAENASELRGVLKAMVQTAKALGYKGDGMHAIIEGDALKLCNENGVTFEYKFDGELIEDMRIKFRLQYFLDAIEMLDDMKAQGITIRFYGNQRPFTIMPKESSDVVALILPIRNGL